MVLLKVTCVKKQKGRVIEIQGKRIPSLPGKILIFKLGTFKPPLIIKGLQGKKKYQVLKVKRENTFCFVAFDPGAKNPAKNQLKDYPECTDL